MARTRSSVRDALAVPVLFVTMALPLGAQCGVQWQPGAPFSGLGGSAYDAALLPNGDIVAGGLFKFAEATPANNVARFDGTTWQPLGGGVNGTVFSVAAMLNGDVVVGGRFTQAGGVPTTNIARWNGTSWSPLGSGLDDDVNALIVLPNGDLIAGGYFGIAGGIAASRIARWDGATWSTLGSGLNNAVYSFAVQANGDLVVGGSFTSAGGVTTRALATWNGTAWGAMLGLDHPSFAMGIAALPNGQVAVVGSLSIGATTSQFGFANGTSVQTLPVPTGLWNEVAVRANGQIVIGGYALGLQTGNVATLNGTTWTQIGNGAPARTMKFLLAGNGDLIAAGMPLGHGVTATNAVARYDGTDWTHLGSPRPPQVNAMVTLRDGDVILGGEFASFRGVAANNVARWRDEAISPLGLGVDGPVRSMALADDGSLVVCGAFASAGGGPANRIARWTGNAWTTVGGGLPWAATTVAAGNGGQVIANANSETRYFDGSVWAPLVLPVGHNLMTFAAAPEGDFILGGAFPTSGTLRFDHGTLTPTVPLPWWVTLLGNDVHGNVLARAVFMGGAEIRRLDGNTWTPLGGGFPLGTPTSMSSLPNGDVLVLASWITEFALARFDGTNWSVLATGLNGSGPITSSGTGDLLVAGEVNAIQGLVNAGFAHAEPSCPSAAAPIGTGCTGAGGPLSLAPDNLPWTGGTFRSTATGFPATSLGVHVIGTQPIAVPLPLGAPGCSLFVTPDVLALLLPANGETAADFVVPNNLALAGVQLRTQVVGLELDASGNLLQLTSTNSLQLTIGGL